MNSKLKLFLSDDLNKRDMAEIYYLDDGKGKRAYSRNDKLSRVFGNILGKIGIEGLSMHIFRYTLATRLTQKSVPVQTIQKILRHKDISTTLRYINSSTLDRQATIDLL